MNIAMVDGIAKKRENSIALFCVNKASFFLFLLICFDKVGKRAVPNATPINAIGN